MTDLDRTHASATVARLVACGIIAGAVWTFLSLVVLALGPAAFLSEALHARGGAPSRHLVMIGANLAASTSALVLYLIARRAGLGFAGSVFTAGCLWWVIASQQSAKWLVLSGVHFAEAAVVAALTLPAMLASVLVGGWLFEKRGTHLAHKG